MKEHRDIEKLFSEKLVNYKTAPPDSIWKNIDEKLSTKPNFPVKKIFFLSAIVILTSIAAFTLSKRFSNNDKKITITENRQINTNEKEHVINTDNNNSNNNTSYNTKKSTSNVISIKTGNNKTENNYKAEVYEKLSKEILRFNALLSNKETNENNLNEITPNENNNSLIAKFNCDVYEGCQPLTVNFENLLENYDECFWDFGNGTTGNSVNPSVTYENPGIYTVSLKIKKSGELSEYKTIVKVNKKPKADFDFEKQLNYYTNEAIGFSNKSQDYDVLYWNVCGETTKDKQEFSYTSSLSKEVKVFLIASTENNCCDTSETEVIYVQDSKYKLYFPTGFTPNLDEQNNGYWESNSKLNDIFHPITKSQIAEFNLKIYNRQGQLIYISNNYSRGWNGYYQNKLAAQGVYVYEAHAKFTDGNTTNVKGNVTLVYNKNR